MTSAPPADRSPHDGAAQIAAGAAWVVCQIGAREHYAVARGLAAHGRLACLFTDAWVRPGSPLALTPALAGRYHADLADAAVNAFTVRAIAHGMRERLGSAGPVARTMRRNAWFQRTAATALRRLVDTTGTRPTVFAYSYAARDILHAARDLGLPTVLGQIDPGPYEARLVADLVVRDGTHRRPRPAKPPAYWERWREETRLADTIVVNSAWSREALEGEGLDPAKIAVVPLAFEAVRRDTARRTVGGPLRALFLGQAIERKGILELIEAADRLAGGGVEIHVVGPAPPHVARRLRGAPLIWHGAQPRSAVGAFYRAADVFVFPTHSDGFGLTQLEAIAHGVPVLATRRCGDVVRDGVNGEILPEVTGPAIAETLRRLAVDRNAVAALAAGALRTPIPRPYDIAGALLSLSGRDTAPQRDCAAAGVPDPPLRPGHATHPAPAGSVGRAA